LVRHLDAQEIRDIFNVRAAQSLAARELCALPDRADAVAVLPKAITEMERRAGANLEDRIESDLTFHRTMCQLTGNETLVHSWTSLEGSIRMSIMFAGVDRAIKNIDAKPSELVDAIDSGDADTAEAAIRDHLASAAHLLVEGDCPCPRGDAETGQPGRNPTA
jgi:DNA-binding FadR family transcriptional regulator